jgi:serine/threonine protein kinase
MYERILRAKLTFPPTVSPAAVSFLSGLLERDVKKRLGSNGSDADELRNHPFFKGLDWEKVFNKEVEPEFKPKGTVCHLSLFICVDFHLISFCLAVRLSQGSELDTENVDEEFKREMPRDTPVVQSASKLAGSTAFAGFTYNPESKLGGI